MDNAKGDGTDLAVDGRARPSLSESDLAPCAAPQSEEPNGDSPSGGLSSALGSSIAAIGSSFSRQWMTRSRQNGCTPQPPPGQPLTGAAAPGRDELAATLRQTSSVEQMFADPTNMGRHATPPASLDRAPAERPRGGTLKTMAAAMWGGGSGETEKSIRRERLKSGQ